MAVLPLTDRAFCLRDLNEAVDDMELVGKNSFSLRRCEQRAQAESSRQRVKARSKTTNAPRPTNAGQVACKTVLA